MTPPGLAEATLGSRAMVRILWALLALVALLVGGTLGFMALGPPGTRAFDAFYMTAITVTTVGYGEIVDISTSQAGRTFAALVAFFGFGILTFIFSSFTVFFLETDLNDALRHRRMDKNIRKLHDHFIVCGLGRVGRNVAEELLATGHRFVAVEMQSEPTANVLERHPGLLHLHGDASDDDMLLAAGIASARGVFAVTGEDSLNLMICVTARQLAPGVRIVARCHEVRNVDKLRKAGADVVVSPDFTGGMRIASSMIRPQVVSFLDEMLRSESHTRIEEVVVPAGFASQPLAALGRRRDNYMLLGVRDGTQMHFNPDDDFIVRGGQTLILMGEAAGRKALEEALGGMPATVA